MTTEHFPCKPWVSFSMVFATLGALLMLIIMTYYKEQPPSDIRLFNETGVELQDVEVNGKNYGKLAAGAFTLYQSHAIAYRYAKVKLQMLDKEVHMDPDCYTGETLLGKGRFTYKIQKMAGPEMAVDVQAVKDPD